MKTKSIQTDEGEINAEVGTRIFVLEVAARRTPTNEVQGSGWFDPEDFAEFLREHYTVKMSDGYGLDAYNKHAGQLIVDVQVAPFTPGSIDAARLETELERYGLPSAAGLSGLLRHLYNNHAETINNWKFVAEKALAEIKPKTKRPKVTIDRPDEETLEIYVGKEYVGGANHDEHGWSGMGAVATLAENMAKELGAKIKKKGI